MATITKELVQQKLDTLHKLARSNPKDLANHFHEKAKLMANHYDSFTGKDAIETYYKKRTEKDPNQEYELRFTVGDVITQGEVGVADGHYELVKKQTGEKPDHGKFLVIFQKAGQEWKIFRLMYNTNTAHHDHKERN